MLLKASIAVASLQDALQDLHAETQHHVKPPDSSTAALLYCIHALC